MGKVERINPIPRTPGELPKKTEEEKIAREKLEKTPDNVETRDILEISDEAKEALERKKKESEAQ